MKEHAAYASTHFEREKMKKIVIAAILALTACASPTQAPIKSADGSSQPGSASSATQTGTLTQSDLEARALSGQKTVQELNKQSVYFDYNSSDIKPEYARVIEEQAGFMKSHPDDVVTLQGNTDERGSDEFNLALGASRANSVRKMMLVLGIPLSKFKIVSFGSQKPRLTCHDESCWKENRRVDFVHSAGS